MSPSPFKGKSKFNTEEKANQKSIPIQDSSEEVNRKIKIEENESNAQSPAHKLKHKFTGSVSSISNGMMNYNTSQNGSSPNRLMSMMSSKRDVFKKMMTKKLDTQMHVNLDDEKKLFMRKH